MSPEETVAAMILIERDGMVSLPARALVTLVSYALAGPSGEAGERLRDEAVAVANASYVTSLREADSEPPAEPACEVCGGRGVIPFESDDPEAPEFEPCPRGCREGRKRAHLD